VKGGCRIELQLHYLIQFLPQVVWNSSSSFSSYIYDLWKYFSKCHPHIHYQCGRDV